MKRILILSSKPPYPLRDGAAIRTFQSIRIFAELGYSVDVLYISETDDYETVKQGIGRLCNNIYHHIITKRQSYLKVLRGLFTNLRPLQVNYFFSYRLNRWIHKNANSYDIVYCNNIRTAWYARNLKVTKILDFVDAYSMNYQAAKEKTEGLWHWIYTIDSTRSKRFEQQMLQAFDKSLIISQIDKDYIISHAKKPKDIFVIENYTEVDASKRVEIEHGKQNLVFVGAMNYEPNISAVKYFSSKIMPTLIAKYPDIRFYIVGKTPTPEVLALADAHTVVTGFVDSTWDYLKTATVVVTPMLSGSGLQNKILQALAVGACVVTTPKGFEGLINDAGQPFVAKDDKEMFDIISHLIDHPEERQNQIVLSMEYVQKHYAVSVIKEKFTQMLSSIPESGA